MSRRGFKRTLWIALAGFGLLLCLLCAGLGLLLYHPAGLEWALQLARSTSPLAIEVERHEGVLAGPLTIHGLRLHDDSLSLQVDELALDWHPLALLLGELHLHTLSVTGAKLKLPSDEPAAASPPAAGFDAIALPLPLALRVDALELAAVEIEGGGKEPLRVDRLSLTARSRGDQLELQRLDLVMPPLELNAQGQVGLSSSLPLKLSLEWRFVPPRQQALQGAGEISGDLQRLQISQRLSGALMAELEATIHDPAGAISWDARAKLPQNNLGDWLEGFPLRLKGELRSQGSPDRIGLQADLELAQPEYGEAALTLRGEYTQGRLHAQRLEILTPAGGRIEASGHYVPDQELGRFDADLVWQDLRWPLQGDSPRLQSPRGSLKLEGSPAAYDYTLATALQTPGSPLAEIDAKGGGDWRGVRLDELLAAFKPGRLKGEGKLAWQPKLAWQLQLKGQDIDPALWIADFPGRLELLAETRGGMEATGLTAEFQLQQLQGQLRDYPVKAQGTGTLSQQTLNLDSFRLTSGDNRIELAGQVAERLALSWRIDAPELQALWPGLGGKLYGSGRVDGPSRTPRIVAKLNGEELSYHHNRADALQLNADVALSGEQGLSLDLHSTGLKLDAGNWQSLDLQLTGALPAHRLSLALTGNEAPRLRLRADAGWSGDKLWQGRLVALELALPQRPAWQLAQATGFTLGVETQRLEAFCLANGDANLCGSFTRAPATGWAAALNAQSFPLAMLQPWLPEGLQIDGRSELRAQLAADAGESPQGVWQMQLPAGRIGLDLESEQERIDFAGGELQGRIDGEGAGLQLKLPLAGLGEVQGAMTLPGFDPLTFEPAAQKLLGQLSLNLNDLSRLSLISPRLQNTHGMINGDFELAGTLQQPQLLGSAELSEGAIDIPELGLELRDIALQLRALSLDQLALNGELRSGNGRLQLDGELDLDAQAGFPSRLHLSGNELIVANLPEAEVHISPQLNIERDRQGTRLKGRIEIPYARLRPRKLPTSAVSVSPDLVVVGSDESERRPFDPRLSTELRVVLGDRVSFDGFGLRGKLTGSLLVIDEPKRPVIGRGRIGITNGTYRAYGQDLSIERGFALYVDNPVDNPGLDVRAVRKIEEVTAGVRVGGTLKDPKIDLFSTPSMGESDILSYLLTGRPAGEGGGQSVGIAAALKATGAGTVAEELGRQFGLEELRLDAGSGLEEASVVAGTYLSPRLYLQYINELASRETKLRMRYDIHKRLQLEAETGKTQAGDLYYTFDR